MATLNTTNIKHASSSSNNIVLDSSGNVGIGTAAPTDYNNLAENLVVATSSDTGITVASGTSSQGSLFFADGTSGSAMVEGFVAYEHGSNFLKLGTGNTERMRIDSSGHVLINCASLPSTSVAGAGFEKNGGMAIFFSSSGSSTSSSNVAEFKNGNGTVGTININGSSTSYNTSSDYRLKENQVAISDGITRLKTLKPYRFNFKADPTKTVDGFFAHEVTAVPEAVTGTKDAVDSDNNPVHQGIDQSKLVPLLTAALQEAITKIETLETKVAALEAK